MDNSRGITQAIQRRRLGRALPVLVLGLLIGLLPATASAAGGSSIATAPPVIYGQQEFGNTAEYEQPFDQRCSDAGGYRSYWNLPVTAGDLLTINWEATWTTELELLPAGTTDFTAFQVETALKKLPSSNGKAQTQYAVPLSGTMPLIFRTCRFAGYTPGPYSFTVTAQHGMAVSLTTPPSTIQTNSVITGTARLTSGAPVPDGMFFTLAVVEPEGTATFSAAAYGGNLSFPLSLPASTAGKEVTMTISRAADGQFLEAKSNEASVTVAAQSPVPAPVKPVVHHRKPLKCHRHFAKRKVHGKAKCVRVGKKRHGRGQRFGGS
jgi:hypothetical protein